ncbi:MAG: hypothetical protein ACKO90_28250, partial [Microcystis panniformis]
VDDTFMNHQAARSDGKISASNQWRYGQTLMNVLYDVWPKKYIEIKDSDYNCFYDNTLVQATLFKLEKEWNNNTQELN